MAGGFLPWQRVETPAAVRLLTNASSRRYFEPFLARECSVGQAARELGVAPNRMLYHVRQAHDLGLLRVVRVQRRAGRAVRFYRSGADGYFVPFEVTPAETLESWLLPLEAAWQARWVEGAARAIRDSSALLGLRLWREGSGGTGTVIAKPTPEPPVPVDAALLTELPVLSLWGELHLDPGDVEELQAALLDLYGRFTPRSGRGRHLVHLAVTPVGGPGEP